MQLHPHFLFNTLHAAATLTREDALAAEDMLLRLAELLRTYLDDDRQEIALQEELELIDLYLGIQRVRFRDRLTSRVHVDPELLRCAVPNLILQPIVENAIGHGIGKHVGADCVEIDCYRVAAKLCIDVRNRNSVLAAAPEDLVRRGIGLSNSRLRLRELYADAGQIELAELSPRGAICRIRLPLNCLAAASVERIGKAA
jgi:LytS/YehU family sensor histidine kinase